MCDATATPPSRLPPRLQVPQPGMLHLSAGTGRAGSGDRSARRHGGVRVETSGIPAVDAGLLAAVFDASPALVYVKDRQNRFTFANPALCRLFGCAREELLGRTTHDMLPAAVADQHRANDERVLREGTALQVEETNEEPDGTHTYLTLKYPLRSAAGDVVAVCGISTDITEQRRREDTAVLGEETLRSLLNAITESAFLMSVDGTVLAANETAAARVGVGLDELVGADVYGFIPAEVAERRRHWVRQVVESGEPVRFEDERGGRILLNSVYPGRGDAGIDRLAVFGHDITELRAAELMLEASEQYFRLIAENATDVVFRASNDGVAEWMSPSVGALVGWRPDELVGRPFVEFVHPDDRETLLSGQASVLAGTPARYDVRVRTKAGDYRWVSVALRPILDEDGTVIGGAGGWHDIQAEVEAREALAELNARLEERVRARTEQLKAANEELEAFAYSVSHDLRAPLRAIDGFSQIVLDDEGATLSDPARANLERVRAGVARMAQLIDAMLTLSRLSRRPLEVRDVDLSAAATAAVERLRQKDPERHVRAAIADGCGVKADAELMDVVLDNLLGNAWKFTSGAEPATIEFGATDAGGERVFFVRDDGAGFDSRYAGKLFQPFQRLHADTEFPGSGVGLATVRRIISRLGGRCWAAGEVGEGATFFFTVGTPVDGPGQTDPDAFPADG